MLRPKGRTGHSGLQPFYSFPQFLHRLATSCVETVHNMVILNPFPRSITCPFYSLLFRPNLRGRKIRYSKNDMLKAYYKCMIPGLTSKLLHVARTVYLCVLWDYLNKYMFQFAVSDCLIDVLHVSYEERTESSHKM